ncbi:hypothetical protein FHW36_1011329 [Chitinophaga polysaccharea]|uniref:YD repeat-containing protein n=1 Tax=Chitinophaga polysaccharea TaxID=1293035 RepID=A0A561Q510_9BACT|nr:hypothetical protein [Chitinophaga polysaccharea]TWF45399.1 hypothetical protein FHW36_1011329 [Chitinophaga polysaccharea]
MNKFITYITLAVLLLSGQQAAALERPDTSGTCFSAVLDTAVNPYSLGIAGNWRPYRTYTYYGQRKDSMVSMEADIRSAGTFAAFAPFWNRQADSTLKPAYDSNTWVWNAQTTLFNVKGLELENKDPLGRYNSGLYGYDNALPVAVIQNGRYRESIFEGFEDYYFSNNQIDTACSSSRNFDFSPYKSNLDTTMVHTGRYALKVAAGQAAAVGTLVVTDDQENFDFTIKTGSLACGVSGVALKSIRADGKVILPSFSPFAGKRMLVGAWIKEANNCSCSTYVNNNVTVKTGTSNIVGKPSGNIIEGWQRIEMVVDIPSGATTFTITLNATGSTAVYFDDIRVHPFNANMKSFVYDPVSLRLMGELDENNYATFYEYDDDGTLVRLKKETERGIKTIKETRSALIKDENP